ncbi:MAG: TorF family putative porin [Gammaproteobacteria bacterium]
MKKLVLAVSAFAAVLWSAAAAAGVSATVTATTDYVFRGITQSAEDPALQGSLDYEADSGFYVGAWASNVDFDDCCDESVELDGYLGFYNEPGENWRYDAGLVYYAYPGTSEDLDYGEIYLGLGWQWFDVYYYYTNDFYAGGDAGFYWDLSGEFELPVWDLGLRLHYGYTGGPALNGDSSFEVGVESYSDYSVALTRDFGNFSFELAYWDTDLDGEFEVTRGAGANDDRIVFSVSTTFPW